MREPIRHRQHRLQGLIACLLTAALLVCSFPALAQATIEGDDYVGLDTVATRGLTVTEAPMVDCDYGILCDAEGNVLWSRQADVEGAMASITKMMTAIVAIENGKLKKKYKVSVEAASVGESSAGLVAGTRVSLYDLLCGLLIHSGNDAGIVIAEGIAGSVDAFVDMMNVKAADLNLEHTHFDNPHGLDSPTHYSTASDLCIIARYAMNNKTFKKIVGKKKATVDIGGTKKTYHSTNSLLNTWNECIGIKTGYTNEAGYCLVSAAVQDGLELYAVVLGCNDESERFTDSYRLLAWGYSHYRRYELAASDEVLAEVAMSAFLNRTVPAGVAEDTYAYVFDYDGDVSVDISYADVSDGVKAGDRLGTVTWRQDQKEVATAPLVALEDRSGPNIFSTVWVALNRLVGFFSGDDCVADTTLYAEPISITRSDDLTGEEITEDMEDAIHADVDSQS